MDSFLLVDNVAFECARPAVAPLEVRFAHPVRLPPATHSQGHGRPCLQSRHPRPGFAECGLLHVYVLTSGRGHASFLGALIFNELQNMAWKRGQKKPAFPRYC